jgi:hypothetical protein
MARAGIHGATTVAGDGIPRSPYASRLIQAIVGT